MFEFFISNILHYIILGISKILRDNRETTGMREATPKRDVQRALKWQANQILPNSYYYCKFSISPPPPGLTFRNLAINLQKFTVPSVC